MKRHYAQYEPVLAELPRAPLPYRVDSRTRPTIDRRRSAIRRPRAPARKSPSHTYAAWQYAVPVSVGRVQAPRVSCLVLSCPRSEPAAICVNRGNLTRNSARELPTAIIAVSSVSLQSCERRTSRSRVHYSHHLGLFSSRDCIISILRTLTS